MMTREEAISSERTMHGKIASQPQINGMIKFDVWTMDGNTYHVDCHHNAIRSLHYAVDAILKETGGTRYSDVNVPQKFGRSYVSFCFKVVN